MWRWLVDILKFKLEDFLGWYKIKSNMSRNNLNFHGQLNRLQLTKGVQLWWCLEKKNIITKDYNSRNILFVKGCWFELVPPVKEEMGRNRCTWQWNCCLKIVEKESTMESKCGWCLLCEADQESWCTNLWTLKVKARVVKRKEIYSGDDCSQIIFDTEINYDVITLFWMRYSMIFGLLSSKTGLLSHFCIGCVQLNPNVFLCLCRFVCY